MDEGLQRSLRRLRFYVFILTVALIALGWVVLQHAVGMAAGVTTRSLTITDGQGRVAAELSSGPSSTELSLSGPSETGRRKSVKVTVSEIGGQISLQSSSGTLMLSGDTVQFHERGRLRLAIVGIGDGAHIGVYDKHGKLIYMQPPLFK